MPDLSGEAILEEVDHPHTYPVIRAFLSKCAGVLILVDAVRLMEGEKDQDFFAMKMLSYLCEMDDDPKRVGRSRPISLIFTKADQCETCFDDPGEFARKHCARTMATLPAAIQTIAFFASGVAGACGFQMELADRGRCRCAWSRGASSSRLVGWSSKSASRQ